MYGFLLTQHCSLEAVLKVLKFQRQGRIGEHYRLGWTVDTPVTQQFQPQGRAPGGGPAEAPGGLDYLNEEGL